MGRYSSGQRGQTVNLLAQAYVGSSPTRPTKQRHPERGVFVLLIREGREVYAPEHWLLADRSRRRGKPYPAHKKK